MLQQLPPAAAREMERLLYNQAHSDREFYARHVTGGSVELEGMERMIRSRVGTGRGHHAQAELS